MAFSKHFACSIIYALIMACSFSAWLKCAEKRSILIGCWGNGSICAPMHIFRHFFAFFGVCVCMTICSLNLFSAALRLMVYVAPPEPPFRIWVLKCTKRESSEIHPSTFINLWASVIIFLLIYQPTIFDANTQKTKRKNGVKFTRKNRDDRKRK